MTTPRSSIPNIVWPGIPEVQGRILMAMLLQVEQSQWWPANRIQAHQFQQLHCLLQHAYQTVPYYRERLAEIGPTLNEPLTPDRWSRLPLLTRQDIEVHQRDLLSTKLPVEHGKIIEYKTSGSAGDPLRVQGTTIGALFWHTLTLRDHQWHGRDLRGRLVAIRSGRDVQDPLAVEDHPTWGPPANTVYPTGPATLLYHLAPLDRQAEILCARNPHYLLVYPSNALALAQHFDEHALRLPHLREVRTYVEPLNPEVLDACREVWGVDVTDVYSAEEVGYIAIQCPKHEHYHVQAESQLVEVLDDLDRPCHPGQIGRVVLTPLHTVAMPLIRYDIGDYAEVGEPCACGRGLGVLNRILGRRRNRITLPDGRVVWPRFFRRDWMRIAPIQQIQALSTHLFIPNPG